MQEEPRGILSRLLGVAPSSAGSIVIYLSVCVCVCVCVSEFCGWETGSDRKQKCPRSVSAAACRLARTGQSGEEDMGRGPSAGWLLLLFLIPAQCLHT